MNPSLAPNMKTALFTNFTSEEFTGYWDGKGKKFAPGKSVWMPDYLAKHFAKHLVNRELLRTDANGNLIYKNGDKFTSPKKPEEVPLFMELFRKAYQEDESEDLGSNRDDIDALISSANKNREKEAVAKSTPTGTTAAPVQENMKPSIPDVQENPRRNVKSDEAKDEKQDPTKPQVVVPPDYDEEDEDEDSFKGKPVEDNA